jgi:hypothetical protein
MKTFPNISEAVYILENDVNCHSGFMAYSPAYVITNEDLRQEMRYMLPHHTDNVLTVAGSGDHPLFCKLNGAQKVTSFDITYNAKIVMDIKTAAVQEFALEDYWELLLNLRKAKNTLGISGIDRIIPHLSEFDQKYLHATADCQIFSKGLGPESYIGNLPTVTEYKKLKSLINKPFPFIWSDIAHLDTKLKESYDFIHTSNIFDHVLYPDSLYILTNLAKYVNVGGRILITEQKRNKNSGLCTYFTETNNNWKIIQLGRINVLQREK